MKKIIPFLFTLLSLSLFAQNQNANLWNGLSVSTSDNLDAINFNPAGLGVDRGTQFAINIQQSNKLDEKNQNVYILTLANRFSSGLAFQSEFDEINRYTWSVAYGTKMFDNFYSGIKYHKDRDYSVGMLYRPFNYLSTGLTFFTNKADQYRDIRYGLSFRPFSLLNKPKSGNKTFIEYSNFTIGYDKLVNYNKNWKQADFSEYYFMSFDIMPGINLGIQKNSFNSSYAINLSMNIGREGMHLTNYPAFDSERSSTSNGIGYFYYSQEQSNKINYLNTKKDNYVLLELEGYFIEEAPNTSPFDFTKEINLLPFMNQENLKGVQLKSFIDRINDIAMNDRIKGLVIKLGKIRAGFGKRKEIYDAFTNFKNTGKEIIVYTDKGFISGFDYYLISMADKIYTNEHTGVGLKGINMEVTFLRGLLDTIYLVPEVVRVSPYKTAGDAILNKKMSDEMKENYGQLIDDYYSIMVNDISIARDWTNTQTKSVVDAGPYILADQSMQAGLIDSTMYPDEFDDYIDSKNIIKWKKLKAKDQYVYDWVPETTPKVAVIYAVGGIRTGKSNPGPRGSSVMGDETIRKAIKTAREDESIKSIVLRIDSGGGSVLASDLIWREMAITTDPESENHKPVIVSMSDVAASGGYYIGCNADKIIADPTTITGSIGVIWARINFSKLMNKIGINFDGIKRGKNADFGSGSHLLTDNERERIFNVIIAEYDSFKQKVLDGREPLSNMDELDEMAQGKIWSGVDAKELGLVDEIGGIHDAINIAKSHAGIDENADIHIEEFPKVKKFSFSDLFNNNESVTLLDLNNIFPEALAEQLEVLELLPVIMDNEIQLLMPYKIILN